MKQFTLCFLVLLILKLSIQNENDCTASSSVARFSDDGPAELTNLVNQIECYGNKIQSITVNVAHTLINVARKVRENTDKYLGGFAVCMNDLFKGKTSDSSKVVAGAMLQSMDTEIMSPKTHIGANNLFADLIIKLKDKIHTWINSMIENLHLAVTSFNRVVTQQIANLKCKVNLLRRSYPAIESRHCSEVLKGFKSAFVVIFESIISCVKYKFSDGTEAVNAVDDLTLKNIQTQINSMKKSWNCMVKKEYNFIFKLTNCVNLGAVRSYWTTLLSLTKTMNESVDENLKQVQEKIVFATCVQSKVRQRYDGEILKVIKSLSGCAVNMIRQPKSTNDIAAALDISTCPRL